MSHSLGKNPGFQTSGVPVITFGHARHAGKGLHYASKGCHSSPELKAWGFLA